LSARFDRVKPAWRNFAYALPISQKLTRKENRRHAKSNRDHDKAHGRAWQGLGNWPPMVAAMVITIASGQWTNPPRAKARTEMADSAKDNQFFKPFIW
jgi:hypothetical protein